MPSTLEKIGYRISDTAIRGFLGAMRLLPYDTRLHVTGLFGAHVLAPLTGARRRIRKNLALVMPDLSGQDIRHLTRAVPYNMGRSAMEHFSPDEFAARIRQIDIEGPGLQALEAAHKNGQGALLVTGHFGNYMAVRAAFVARGYNMGGLYKPMSNPYFNAHYVTAFLRHGEPMFERSRRGMAAMVRFLRKGGWVGIVLDQRMNDAPILSFMGKPARTSLSVAELALKYDVLAIPAYGIRQPNGNYRIVIEAPIEPDTPEAMTQALNDSLETQIRAHPEQWMWTHNRWKNAGNTV